MTGADVGQTGEPDRARSAERPPTAPTHTVRNSLIDRQRAWTIGPDALHWREARRQGSIPYGDIRQVRLISYANTGGEQYQCVVTAAGRGRVKIRSHHYVSLGNFEDRTATYAPLIRDLLKRVAAASPGATFVAGSIGLLIVWMVVLLLFILGVATAVLAYFDGLAGTWKFAITVGVLILSGPLIWRRLAAGAVRPFDPADPPPNLLGDR